MSLGFWRLVSWYVLLLEFFFPETDVQQVPWNDAGLNTALDNGAKGAAASPWVAAIVNAGIGASSFTPPGIGLFF